MKKLTTMFLTLLLLMSGFSSEILTLRASTTEEKTTNVSYTNASVSFDSNGFVESASVHGVATRDREAAAEALRKSGIDSNKADSIADSLFSVTRNEPKSDPVKADPDDEANLVVGISAHWMTEDTTDNGDPDELYFAPKEDDKFSIRLQINYSLSGQNDYPAETVRISFPATIIVKRNGEVCEMTLPFPAAPSTTKEWNYQIIDGNFVITNTKTLPAATKGYIQVGFADLIPHELVDMQLSEDFIAKIDVTLKEGASVISGTSNTLTARIDTDAKITKATKGYYSRNGIRIVDPSYIPSNLRDNNETAYVLVDWYIVGMVKANTEYNIDFTDKITDSYGGIILSITNLSTGCTTSRNPDGSFVADNGYNGYTNGKFHEGETPYFLVKTAYPISSFEKDNTYTFENKIIMDLFEVDDDTVHSTQEASAKVDWYYHDPVWENPTGHYMVCKNGNDNAVGNYKVRQIIDGQLREKTDYHLWSGNGKWIDGWYGVYPSGLNQLQDAYAAEGEDGSIEICYTINSIGYVMPWMYDQTAVNTDGELAARKVSNYNRPVTMVTTDTGFCIGRNGEYLTVGEDYRFSALEVPDTLWIYAGVPHNINPDGTWVANNYADGTFLYTRDYDKTHFPDVEVQIMVNGQWQTYATVSWKTGSYKITFADGRTQTDTRFDLPENTENFQTIVILQNTSDEKCLQAALEYDVRVYIDVYSTEDMIERIDNLFVNNNAPQMVVYNNCILIAYDADGKEACNIPKDGYNVLRGYTTDTAAYIVKKSEQTLKEIDTEHGLILIHYSAEMEQRSFITDEVAFEQAVAEGRVETQTHGFWYDLLPKGVYPVDGSVKLRENDTIISVETREVEYNGETRTMLIVEADLVPQSAIYTSNSVQYYCDKLEISFDAYYPLQLFNAYGDYLHNVIAYESSNPSLGTVPNYMGEPDTPNSNNNITTSRAFDNDVERALMTNLDPNNDNPSFVYAGVYSRIDVISYANISLQKAVQVNGEGPFGDGLWEEKEGDDEGNARRRAENEKVVYEGGTYTYMLSMMPDENSQSANMVIFDSLENFYPTSANNPIDDGAPRWNGYFRGIDVSDLVSKGCGPVVYYYIGEDPLELSAPGDPTVAHPDNTNIHNESIWTKAETYSGSLDAVKAVAVDATYQQDGKTPFILNPYQEIVIFIHMQAPSGAAARGYIANDAHAYNNAVLIGTSIDVESHEVENDKFVRKDYTKVGLKEFEYEVEKVWDDDDDRDGRRVKSITVHLLANGKDTGKSAVLSDDNDWHYVFEDIPYTDENGKKIVYSASEDIPEYYTLSTEVGESYTIFKNKHIPERTKREGTKTWVVEEGDPIPTSITVVLYGNGKEVARKTVTAANHWKYEFTNLYKYEKGEEIVYEIAEVITSTTTHTDYISEIDGFDIKNTYHPFGDLIVVKTLDNYTPASKEKEFTFSFTFIDANGEPVFEEYYYEVLDAEDNFLREGTITTNGMITIKGFEKIHVKEIEKNVTYRVTEGNTAGFVCKTKNPMEGIIYANETAVAEFINRYSAHGDIVFDGFKALTGTYLEKYMFTFDLYDITDPDNPVYVNSAYNEEATSQTTNENGEIVYRAPFVFAPVEYSEADDGKTYRYQISERIKNVENGITYDTNLYTVSVTISDNGDGTMTVTPHYEYEDLTFINTYYVENEFTPLAWKELKGRDLVEGQFTFELIEEVDNNGVKEYNVIQTKTNDSDGLISFDTIKYTQKDDGKTFYYLVHEVIVIDEEITYDETYYGYKVVVTDDKQGLLKVESTQVEPKVHFDDDGKITSVQWGEKGRNPEFVNRLHPGKLDITKHVINPEIANPAQEFRFHVVLIGSDIPDGKIPYTITYNPNIPTVYGTTGNGGNTPAPAPARAVTDLTPPTYPEPDKIYHVPADQADTLLAGDAYVIFVQSEVNANQYDMIAFRSTETLADGDYTDLDIGDPSGKKYTGHVFGGIETYDDGRPGYSRYPAYTSHDYTRPNAWQSRTRTFRVMDGVALKLTSMEHFFYYFASLVDCDLSRVDTSEALSFSSAFEGCQSLPVLDVKSLDTSSANEMTSMFALCYQISSLDLANFDTSNVTDISAMFAKMSNMEYIDLSHFDTSKVTRMVNLFYAYYGYGDFTPTKWKYINLSSWDTRNVTDMRAMFWGLKTLTGVNVKGEHFDTSNVRNMTLMFDSCEKLTELDLSGWYTPNLQTMSAMFAGCKKLETLDIRNFDTRNIVDMPQNSGSGDYGLWFGMKEGGLGTWNGYGGYYDTNNIVPTSILKKVILGPNFRFPARLGNTDKNTRRLNNASTTSPYDGYWVRDDNPAMRYTSEDLWKNWTGGDMAGVWVWETAQYTVNYTAEEGVLGSMDSVRVNVGSSYTLAENRFVKRGYRFDHWIDEATGKTYADKETIPARTFQKDHVLTLKAVFVEAAGEADIRNGEFDIVLMDGETAHFENLPAGTEYYVYELTPAGWKLVYKSGDHGFIVPNETAEAYFENEATPGEIYVNFHAMKMMNREPADEGDFKFVLAKINSSGSLTTLQTVTNKDGGIIEFEPVRYTGTTVTAGDNYVIYEVAGNDETIRYSTERFNYNVKITRVNGELQSSVTSKVGGVATFYNEDQPGSLYIRKSTNYKNADGRIDFEVRVYLMDKTGKPFESGRGYEVKNTPDPNERSIIVFTDDEGALTLHIPNNGSQFIQNLPKGTKYRVEEIVPQGWTLKGITNAEGTIISNEYVTVDITNEYHSENYLALKAYKSLRGGELKEGQFEFELSVFDPETKEFYPVEVVTNSSVDTNEYLIDEDGNKYRNPHYGMAVVEFTIIDYTFEDEGWYGYRVREVIKDDDNKIIYDGINYYVEVEVMDDLKGHLDVRKHIIDSIDGNYNEYKEMIFNNTEKSGRLKIEKIVEGEGNDKFTFTVDLKDEDGNPLTGEFRTVLTRAGATVKPPVVMMTFPTTITLSGGDTFMILGLPVGTQYAVEEINIPEYWKLVKSSATTGVIDVEKDNDIVVVSFVNEKDIPKGDPVSITLNARKTLEGGTIDEGNDFLFQLLDEKMNVLQTVSVDSLGAATSGITFKPIEYPFSKEASHYTYYIKEIQGSDANIIYDKTTYVVEVDVTPPDKLPGAMTAEYHYYKYVLDEETGEDVPTEVKLPEFVNEVHEMPGALRIEKIVEGLQNELFTFRITLTDKNGKALTASFPYVRTTEDGDVEGTIKSGDTFQLRGSESIKISELPDGTKYVIEEINVPKQWKMTASENLEGTIIPIKTINASITNKFVELTEATVVKIWDDADDQDGERPDELKVNLMNGTEVVATVTLNEKNNWTATVKDLVKYDDNDKEIEYTWAEGEMPEGYTLTNTSKEGTVTSLTNSYPPKETEIHVIKIWDDKDNKNKKRPTSIKVQLYANGVEVGEPVELKEGSWEYTWSELPLRSNGKDIEYEVKELNIPQGYRCKVKYDKTTGFVITNTEIPDTGDHRNPMMWALIMTDLVVAMAAIVIVMKKKLLLKVER